MCTCEERSALGSREHAADCCALLVAGGSGERFGDPRGKQFVDLCGLPLLLWPLVAFDRAPSIACSVVVCASERIQELGQEVLSRVVLRKPVIVASAGATRQESVYSGLQSVPVELEFVAVHDAVRPLVETSSIEACIACVRENRELAGAILAARCINTLKMVEDTTIIATPDRNIYWEAQTPQVFRTKELKAAHRSALFDGFSGTDDASLVERRGGKVRVVESLSNNLKVTLPEDLAIAEALLGQRLVSAGYTDFSAGDAQDGTSHEPAGDER